MATGKSSNTFLDIGLYSDDSDENDDRGYDSEAAEQVKGGRLNSSRSTVAAAPSRPARKRRKVSPTSSDGEGSERESGAEVSHWGGNGVGRQLSNNRNREDSVDEEEEEEEEEVSREEGFATRAEGIAPPAQAATAPGSNRVTSPNHVKKDDVAPPPAAASAAASTDPTQPTTTTTTGTAQKQRQNETHHHPSSSQTEISTGPPPAKKKKKDLRPGVIYLSSLPPYLRPSALRNLLTRRGFSPITRIFLSPASKSHKSRNPSTNPISTTTSSSSSSSSRRTLYSEGWIEFASHRTARLCAETLNAHAIGGPKGGFYHDDVWNILYLRGMGWAELMAGVREEKREEEGRRDEERRVIARETRQFVDGVERGKMEMGMERKKRERMEKEKKKKNRGSDGGGGVGGGGDGDGGEEQQQQQHEQAGPVKRTWRQFRVHGRGPPAGPAAAGEQATYHPPPPLPPPLQAHPQSGTNNNSSKSSPSAETLSRHDEEDVRSRVLSKIF